MHSPLSRGTLAARALLFFLASALVSACGGGGSASTGTGSIPNTLGSCGQGLQAQIARPAPNQTGVGNINSIEIVASSNNNNLYSSYQSYDLLVTPSGASPASGIVSNFLTLTSDQNGPHPYGSDYYYNANLGQAIPSGYWDVYLNAQSSCQPYYLGSFGT